MKRRFARVNHNRTGYSLIEVLVSGMLLSFLVSSVVTVVGMCIDIETGNDNRRQARSILRSEFEQNFNFRNFNTIPADTAFSKAVLVNPLAHDSISGTLSARIATNSFGTNSGTNVQIKHITLTLSWTDLKGNRDSLQFFKDISNVQP